MRIILSLYLREQCNGENIWVQISLDKFIQTLYLHTFHIIFDNQTVYLLNYHLKSLQKKRNQPNWKSFTHQSSNYIKEINDFDKKYISYN